MCNDFDFNKLLPVRAASAAVARVAESHRNTVQC